MRWLPRVIVAMIAVLLPAGALAMATVDSGGRDAAGRDAGGGRAGAAGLAQEAITEAPPVPVVVTSTTSLPPIVLPPQPLLPPPTVPRAPVTGARPPASTAPPSLPPGVGPGLGPTTTVAAVTRTSSWSRNANGVTVRMRMEPAAPVAGQPITFFIDDVSAPYPCCIVHMSFGDGTDMPALGSGGGASGCDSPKTRTGLTASHTFAAPGAYAIALLVVTYPCNPVTAASGEITPPPITGTEIRACIAVGPGTVPDHCAPL